MTVRQLLPLLLLALASACATDRNGTGATDDASVVLEVAPDPAGPRESIRLTLRNGSDETLGYNLCTSALERRSGETWNPVPEDRVCTMELRTLEPAAQTSTMLDLPADLDPGEYRYLTNVERMATGAREPVRSDPFTVDR